MFNTILAATDGSDHARRAIDLAAELARTYDAGLIVLSVYRHHSMYESSHSLIRAREKLEPPDDALKRVAQEVVDGECARARELGVETVKGIVRRGHPARSIVDVAKQHKADTIVLGSRGYGDLGGLLLGSVSHKVSSIATCTCIIAK